MAAKKRKRRNPAHAQSNPGAGLVIGLIALAVVGYGVWAVSEGISEAKKKVKKAINEATPAPTPDRTKPAPTPDRAKPAPAPTAITEAQVLAHVREILEREAPPDAVDAMMDQLRSVVNTTDVKSQWPCIMAAMTFEEISACAGGGSGPGPVDDSWKSELQALIEDARIELVTEEGRTFGNSWDGSSSSYTNKAVWTLFEDLTTGATAGKKNYQGIVAVIGNEPGEGPLIRWKAFQNQPSTLQSTNDMHYALSKYADEIAVLSDQHGWG